MNDDPIQGIDPTGLLGVFSQEFGYAVEDEIETLYSLSIYGANNMTYGRWARLPELLRAKPDILDRTRQRYMEIKPLSPSGIIAAIAQMALRQTQFLPLGYYPDATWHVEPHTIYPLGIPTIFFNVAGVLFYTDVIDLGEDYVAIVTLDQAWKLLGNPKMAKTYGVAIARVLGLSNSGRAADGARGQGHFSIAYTIAALGFI